MLINHCANFVIARFSVAKSSAKCSIISNNDDLELVNISDN